MNAAEEKKIFTLFRFTLFIKGMNGLLEVAGAAVILFVSKAYLITHVLDLLQSELSDDPNDKVANFIVNLAASYSVNSQYFFGIYMLAHGVVKLVLVIGLLKRKLRIYPLAITVFAAFCVYEFYRLSLAYSLWMLGLAVLDFLIVCLTVHEYRLAKRKALAFTRSSSGV